MENEKLTCDKYSNLIAALILCFHFINGVIGISGISILSIGIIIGLKIISLCENKYFLDKGVIFLIFSILMSFVLSIMRVPEINYTISYMTYFLAFGIVALLSGVEKIDVEKVVRIILYLGVLGICIHLIRGFEGLDSGITMGISYSMLPVFFSAIIAMLNYKELRLLAGVCTSLSLYIFVFISPRGVWLTILFFLFFVILFKIVHSKCKFKQNLIKVFVIISAMVVIWLFIEYLYEIVTWVNSFFQDTFNLSISALKKILYYYKKGDVLNGRTSLWSTAYMYILESPLVGEGIGYFEYRNSGAHPHNIVLQAICEQGVLIGGIVILFLVIKALKILFTTNSYVKSDRYGYAVMIISCGLEMLLFSSSYWLWVPFWYFVGYIMSGERNGVQCNRRE